MTHGWNQTQLSEMTGIERTRLNRIENGKAWPEPEELEALHIHLGVSYAALVDAEKPDLLYLAEFLLNELDERDRHFIADGIERLSRRGLPNDLRRVLTSPRPTPAASLDAERGSKNR